MKTTQKIFALLLALAMVLSMAVTAFADTTDQYGIAATATDSTGTITITNAAADTVYKIYRIFDIARVGEDTDGNGQYPNTYVPSEKWKTYIENSDAIKLNKGFVTDFDWTDAQEFAEDIIKNIGSITADGTSDALRSSGAYTTKPYPYGYYVMVSSRVSATGEEPKYTVFALDRENVQITEKNTNVPVLSKTVQEDSDGKWYEENDAEIGQVINFKIELTAMAGMDAYYLRDDLENMVLIDANGNGSFEDDIVLINHNGSAVVNQDYELSVDEDENGFTIIFTQSYREGFGDQDKLEVEYSAKLLPEAGTGRDNGNVNTVVLYDNKDLTNNTGAVLPTDSTTTYTYELEVKKINENEQVMAGATFQLLCNGEAVGLKLVEGTRYAVDPTSNTTTVTTDDTGIFTITGLDGNTAYVLDETQAPDKYVEMENQTIDITNENEQVTVLNLPGVEMPTTGGMGTTIFYAIGGLMTAAALVLLITKKRMAA